MNKDQFTSWLKQEIKKCHTKAAAFQFTLDELAKLDKDPGRERALFDEPPAKVIDLPVATIPANGEPEAISDERLATAILRLGSHRFRPARFAQYLGVTVKAATGRCYRLVEKGVFIKVAPNEFQVAGTPGTTRDAAGAGQESAQDEPVVWKDIPQGQPFVPSNRSTSPLFNYDEELTTEQKLEKAVKDLSTAERNGEGTLCDILRDKIASLNAMLGKKADK